MTTPIRFPIRPVLHSSALLLAIAGGLAAAESDQPAASGSGSITVTGEETYRTRTSSTALFGDALLIETPFSVGVIDRSQIEDQRAFTTEQALLNDASVAVLGAGSDTFYGRQDFSVRGFGVDNFYGYRVDGMPATHMGEQAMDDKERVEVLKGPAGLRFGFMGPGGTVNYVRKRPTETSMASAHFDVNSFGLLYTQLDIGGRTGDDAIGYRLVAAGEKFDSFYDNADGSRMFGSAFIDWRVNEAVTAWVSLSQQDRDQTSFTGTLVSNNGVIHDRGPEANYAEPWSRSLQDFRTISVGVDVDLTEEWSLHTSNSYDESSRGGNLSYVYGVTDDGDYTSLQWLTGTQSWTHWANQTHVEGTFHTGSVRHDLAVGGSIRGFVTTMGNRPPNPALGDSNVDNVVNYPHNGGSATMVNERYREEELGLFVTDTVAFTDMISALVGFRYANLSFTSFSGTGVTTAEYDDSAFSPSLAIMVEPIENLHTYLSYTQGMQGGGTAPGTTTNAGERMAPIESRQLEIGVKADFLDGRLTGEFALFGIERDLEYTNGSNTYVQDGLRRHTGIELAMRGRITDPLAAGFNLMILDADQKETGNPALNGQQPANTAKYQVNLWTSYEIDRVPGLGLNLSARAVSARYADAAEAFEMDAYIIVNAGVCYRFEAADAWWTTRLNLENLADEVYYTGGAADSTGGGAYVNGAPFGARVSLQADF